MEDYMDTSHPINHVRCDGPCRCHGSRLEAFAAEVLSGTDPDEAARKIGCTGRPDARRMIADVRNALVPVVAYLDAHDDLHQRILTRPGLGHLAVSDSVVDDADALADARQGMQMALALLRELAS
jgi:hypothetical protein